MINGLVLSMLLDLSGSLIVMQDTTNPLADAEIVFENVDRNGAHENGEYVVEHDGKSAIVEFRWNYDGFGEDAILVTPPDGMICDPIDCILSVPEGTTRTLYLIPWAGM